MEPLGGDVNEESVPPVDAEADPLRLSRRAAMRAAAGTAVTAGFVLVPSIAGASVPEYASSASGDDDTQDVVIDGTLSQATPRPLCLVKCCIRCWNTSGIYTQCGTKTCPCGTHKTPCGTCQ